MRRRRAGRAARRTWSGRSSTPTRASTWPRAASAAALAELPVPAEELLAALELTGAPGYGYPPLDRAPRRAGRATGRPRRLRHRHLDGEPPGAGLGAGPGDEVLIEQPTYELLVSAARYLGADVRRFPRRFADGWAIDPDAVERAMTPRTRLVVVTNLHNPTGVRTPDAVLAELAARAERRGARLLVDEVYLEACFDPAARSACHLGRQRPRHRQPDQGVRPVRGALRLGAGATRARPEDAPPGRSLRRQRRPPGRAPERPRPRPPRTDRRARAGSPRRQPRPPPPVPRQASRPRGGAPRPRHHRLPPTGGWQRRRPVPILRERYDTSVVPGRFFDEPEHVRIGLGGPPDDLEEGLRRLGMALDDLAGEPSSAP